jgi:hypothetical protein
LLTAGALASPWKIQTALEAAGVEFIPADEEKAPGLRLKHKVRGKEVKQGGEAKRESKLTSAVGDFSANSASRLRSVNPRLDP